MRNTAAPPLNGVSAQASGPVPGGTGLTELGLAAMILIWGVNFAVVKRALLVFDPLGFNSLRYLIASAVVYAVLRSRGPLQLPRREDLPRILLLGLVGNLVYQMVFIFGLDRTRAGNASLMLALVPVFVLMLGWRSEPRHGPRVVLGILLSVIGVALVSGSTLRLEGAETLTGDALMLTAALIWAGYTLGTRPLIARYGSMQSTAWTLWVGAAGIFLAGVPSVTAQSWEAVGPVEWGGLLFSSIFSIGLAYLLWYRGVERIGGARTAAYSNLTPVVAMATGWLWLGERLTLGAVLGAGMVLGGVAIVRSGRGDPG